MFMSLFTAQSLYIFYGITNPEIFVHWRVISKVLCQNHLFGLTALIYIKLRDETLKDIKLSRMLKIIK